MRHHRLAWMARAALLGITLLAATESRAQQSDELTRLVGQYRGGSIEPVALRLQALIRTAETSEQRALLEYHLGAALVRTRPAESAAAFRRSIALDPDRRPDPLATEAERTAWEAVRAQSRVPSALRFEAASAIAGNSDSVTFVLEVPVVQGILPPRARILLATATNADPIELWTGTAGERGAWDGTFAGLPARSGTYPLIIEVFDEPGAAPIRWRRLLEVKAEPITESLVLPPRPPRLQTMVAMRVGDPDARSRTLRRGFMWMIVGSTVAFTASRTVPDAIRISTPNSATRIGVASVYGAGLAASLYGSLKALRATVSPPSATVMVPDEAVAQRQRFADATWRADSIRVTTLSARRETLRRVTLQVRERR